MAGLEREKEMAIGALQAAGTLSRLIQESFCPDDFLTKNDRSPVTIADFAIQALVAKTIFSRFPEAVLIGEEDASCLREGKNSALIKKIQDSLARLYHDFSYEEILKWIDRGSSPLQERYWTLDPIDGTKGFLRNDQFAIALALVERGEVLLAAMCCPRLTELKCESSPEGFLFFAIKNEGAHVINASNFTTREIRVSRTPDFHETRMVESYESSHSDTEARKRIQQKLGISTPPLQMDGQVKYGLVAAGDCEIYLRIPHPSHLQYKEKIWDHAAGSLIVAEAGGKVTDILGQPLDFTAGKSLSRNFGILVTNSLVHDRVLSAISSLSVG